LGRYRRRIHLRTRPDPRWGGRSAQVPEARLKTRRPPYAQRSTKRQRCRIQVTDGLFDRPHTLESVNPPINTAKLRPTQYLLASQVVCVVRTTGRLDDWTGAAKSGGW